MPRRPAAAAIGLGLVAVVGVVCATATSASASQEQQDPDLPVWRASSAAPRPVTQPSSQQPRRQLAVSLQPRRQLAARSSRSRGYSRSYGSVQSDGDDMERLGIIIGASIGAWCLCVCVLACVQSCKDSTEVAPVPTADVVVVTQVEDKCAATGFLKEGDHICAINGTKVTDHAQATTLAKAAVGDVVYSIVRDDNFMSVTVHKYSAETRLGVGVMTVNHPVRQYMATTSTGNPTWDALGEEVLTPGGDTRKLANLRGEGKFIGLYFGRVQSVPCKAFTPKLVDAYNSIRAAGKSLEIIFISVDRDMNEFTQHFSTMPWLAIPFDNQRSAELANLFKVKGVPGFIILNGATGNSVSGGDMRCRVMTDPKGTMFPWSGIQDQIGSQSDATQLAQLFYMLDTDKSGAISMTELSKLLPMLGIDVEKALDVLRTFDHDASGTLDFTEFNDFILETQILLKTKSMALAFPTVRPTRVTRMPPEAIAAAITIGDGKLAEAGDRVVAINGMTICSATQAKEVMASVVPGGDEPAIVKMVVEKADDKSAMNSRSIYMVAFSLGIEFADAASLGIEFEGGGGGALVASVEQELSGFIAGDVILSIDGKTITGGDMAHQVAQAAVGEYKIAFMRNGRVLNMCVFQPEPVKTFMVTMEDLPPDHPAHPKNNEGAK